MNVISQTAKIYRDVRVVNSIIADNCTVADDCDLIDVNMEAYSEFGRRNLIRNVNIGYGSYTGSNTTLKYCSIGKFCCISSDVNIYGGEGHNYLNTAVYSPYWYKRVFSVNVEEYRGDRTTIGSDVWIGTNSVILNGLYIGDGAVIGAGSVVTKDVQPYSIVVGNPAREIKKRFCDEYIESLLNIQWWNFPPNILKDNVHLLSSCMNREILKELYKLKDEF